MSRCEAQPSTPCSVRTLNQSVRRNSTSANYGVSLESCGCGALVDRHGRIQRVVEELCADVQPLGDQAKLGRGEPVRVRARRTGRKPAKERSGVRAVGAAPIHIRSYGYRVAVGVRHVMLEEQVAV